MFVVKEKSRVALSNSVLILKQLLKLVPYYVGISFGLGLVFVSFVLAISLTALRKLCKTKLLTN